MAATSTAPAVGGRPSRLDALREPYVRALLGIMVLGAVIRFAVIGIPSYWLDEAYTILIVKGSLGNAFDLIPKTESTPPLYYVLEWGWTKAFGTGETGARSLSALFGVLTIPVAAATAVRLVDRRTALVTAAMLAVNPFLIWFAQEARAYALMVLLAAIGFHLFVRYIDRPERRTLVWWTVVSALLLLTHYYGALMIAAEAAWMLTTLRTSRRAIAAGLGAIAVVGVALLPLVAAQRSNRLAIPLSEESSTVLRTVQVPKQFVVGFDAPAEVWLGIFCTALIVGGIALLFTRREPAERDRLAPAAVVGLAVLIVPIGLAIAGFDFVSARYEVAAMVPLTILVAAGFAATRAARLGLALAGVLLVTWTGIVIAVASDPLLQTRADWRHGAEALGPVPPGGRAVILTPSSGRKSFQVYLPDAELIKTPNVSISEIDVLTVRSAKDEKLGALAPPPGAPRIDVPASFKEVERKKTRTYMLLRYRSPGPASVAINTLGGLRLDDEGWVGLVERP